MTPGRGARPKRKDPLPHHAGNTYTPFTDLIKLEKLDNQTYRSIALPFAPGGTVGMGRTYGAHVYMQAAWAACQTVPSNFLLHNISGNFLLAGELDVPFIYKVKNVRSGRSYATRTVNVTQSESKGICFTCICSFKLPEHRQVESQAPIDIWTQYSSVLDTKTPSDFPEAPGLDVPFYWQRRSETGLNDEFPGLECKRVDMTAYNDPRNPLDKRQLIFYRTIGEMPEDPNMHLCAHLYASDRNSLFIVANAYELGDYFTSMSSLVHTVVFHGPASDLTFRPGSGTSPLDDQGGRWFCMEAYGSRMDSGRALFNARISNSEGRHGVTAMQDGLIRFTASPEKATDEELKVMDAVTAKSKQRGKEKL